MSAESRDSILCVESGMLSQSVGLNIFGLRPHPPGRRCCATTFCATAGGLSNPEPGFSSAPPEKQKGQHKADLFAFFGGGGDNHIGL